MMSIEKDNGLDPSARPDPRVVPSVERKDVAVRVLVVDDSSTCRAIIAQALVPSRAEVVQVASGSEALRLLQNASFDLVTLDLDMPDMRGELMLVELRRKHPLLPVVIITGIDTGPNGNARLYDAGANAILQKPFDEATVYGVVHGLLRGHRHPFRRR